MSFVSTICIKRRLNLSVCTKKSCHGFYFTLLATAFTTIVAGAKRTLYGAKQQESNIFHFESSLSSSVTFEVFLDSVCGACVFTGFFFGGMNIFVYKNFSERYDSKGVRSENNSLIKSRASIFERTDFISSSAYVSSQVAFV